MKNRKPTLAQQEAEAKERLVNEISLKKLCLSTASEKVDELIEKIKSGDTSKKTQKLLAEQREIALGIKAWLTSHEKTA